ncbi:alpha-amylase family glycosyl hydrolase [Hymenobacter chitinivorans]|uniref:Putative secreted protein (Por secretion system target) n=1 Tax=Hymenobacter chitinivorans DSM 11115 TaxID=1121954 RepID=A0A2M9BRM0_9BACT|nr:alpha-amylase family glycosyl hydrolase [Hymenobacter chitinivorans]PJJ60587.1 putative secreted protein (Por secretion system target) [Hymenobacter chitinivorans DSM 11115]
MKHLFAVFCCLLVGSLAQANQLTFRVDMSRQTVPAAGVHVAGSFQAAAGFGANWNPATTALTDADHDNVWEATVNVPAGVYLYKFVNGNGWPGAELPPASCGLDDGGGNVNRQVVVGGSSVRLPIVAFGECATQLRFAVDMTGQTVASGGVHVVGNFQALAGYGTNDDATAIPLLDDNGDGVYEVQLSLPAPGRFQYRFVNGSTLAGAETVPAGCGSPDNSGTLTRVVDATAAVNTPPALCFGQCTACSGVPPTGYTTHWWNDAVFYEVFVRSFYDSNGDGQGDFAGLIQKLDYLNDGNAATTTDLGITGLWLMPMMESPSYHGYDVTNYKATEPDYGSMAQFEAFLAAAHQRGIKVIIDLVLNHSSSQHPWFQQSASSPTNAYRNWYLWSPTDLGFGPFGGSGWHLRNGQYFYGAFWDGMPDLNWRNPDLKAAMWDASRFWLQKGVDGYRLDAVRYFVETGSTTGDTPETLAVLEEFHDVIKAENPATLSVGEAWTSTRAVVPYVQNDRLDLCFEFDLATAMITALKQGSAAGLTSQLNLVNNLYPRLQYATFLTNHDQNRVFDELGSNVARMKQAAALYLTMPGVPFLYYGEEIGMAGSGADEDKRRPMQWTAGAQAGFTTGTPWRAPNANYPQVNVAAQQADPASLLNHYKKLIGLRNAHEPLRKGYYLPVSTASAATVAYARVYGPEAVVVAANLGNSPVSSLALSLPVSTLAAGAYRVVDLYSGQAAGTVTLDSQGGFNSWTATLPALAANQTWVLRLQPSATLATTRPAGAALTLALYPNPGSGAVRLTLDTPAAAPAQVQAFDLTGRLVHSARFEGKSYALNVSNWTPGTYFVRVQAGSAVAVQRLVVGR